MIRANDYVEVNTDDMNIVIKGLVSLSRFNLVDMYGWSKLLNDIDQ